MQKCMYKGLDVSKWQGSVDWKRVRGCGFDFVMLRDGFGKTEGQEDICFAENYEKARQNGLYVGAYHYSYAKTVEDAEKEAKYCLSLLKGKRFEFPIALDVEDACQQSLSVRELSEIIRAFCEKLESAGYYVSVYANLYWLLHKIDADCKKRYDIWLAQWAEKPTYDGDFGMWQYTSDGRADGILGRVDLDFAYKDYPRIMEKNGLNGFPKKTESPQKLSGGQKVYLNNAPLFVSSSAEKPARHINGMYYLYDGKAFSGRYRVTVSPNFVGKTPASEYVTGYIREKDLR